MKGRVTKRAVDALRGQAIAGAQTILLWDEDVRGFGVLATKAGSLSYFIEYRPHPGGRGTPSRRLTVGKHGPMTPDEARRRARQLLAEVGAGKDPARAKGEERQASSLGRAIELYLAARRDGLRPKTHAEFSRYLRVAWRALHGLAVHTVQRRYVVAVLNEIEAERGRTAADRARGALSAFYGWAIDRSYCEVNPVSNIRQRHEGGARCRVLSEAELTAVWKACRDDDYGSIVQLLILTGQRREEIAGLMWPEIDFERREIRLPAERVKNGRPHTVPLSDVAMAILRAIPRRLERDFVFGNGARGFQGWSRAKRSIDKRLPAEMPAWTLHDIRRSVATHLGENGFTQPHVVEAIMNHISGHKGGVAGIYNRSTYANEKRQALDLWGAHITALTEGRANNIIALASGRS